MFRVIIIELSWQNWLILETPSRHKGNYSSLTIIALFCKWSKYLTSVRLNKKCLIRLILREKRINNELNISFLTFSVLTIMSYNVSLAHSKLNQWLLYILWVILYLLSWICLNVFHLIICIIFHVIIHLKKMNMAEAGYFKEIAI